jgi:hypothetical protein
MPSRKPSRDGRPLINPASATTSRFQQAAGFEPGFEPPHLLHAATMQRSGNDTIRGQPLADMSCVCTATGCMDAILGETVGKKAREWIRHKGGKEQCMRARSRASMIKKFRACFSQCLHPVLTPPFSLAQAT